MPPQKQEKLREEFQEFADSIIWSNDDGSEKYIGVGNMADWWISRFDSYLASKRKEIKKSKTKRLVFVPNANALLLDDYELGKNSGLDTALQILSE